MGYCTLSTRLFPLTCPNLKFGSIGVSTDLQPSMMISFKRSRGHFYWETKILFLLLVKSIHKFEKIICVLKSFISNFLAKTLWNLSISSWLSSIIMISSIWTIKMWLLHCLTTWRTRYVWLEPHRILGSIDFMNLNHARDDCFRALKRFALVHNRLLYYFRFQILMICW